MSAHVRPSPLGSCSQKISQGHTNATNDGPRGDCGRCAYSIALTSPSVISINVREVEGATAVCIESRNHMYNGQYCAVALRSVTKYGRDEKQRMLGVELEEIEDDDAADKALPCEMDV